MNKSDSERIAGYLENLGYKESDNRKEAELVIITTCGVRQSAEDRVYGLVPKIKKENKRARIILTGCLSEREDVKKRLNNQVEIWLPVKKLPLLAFLLAKKECRPFNGDYLKLKPKYNSRLAAFVPIGNGCNNFCAYCVVPYARGREIYRPAAEIIKEVENLINNGYKEIILIAQNVNSYKSESRGGNINFARLLKKINNIKGDFWIRFATSHPKDMSDELIKVVARLPKVCPHIHLPAQAGDNAILRAMNRCYTIGDYKKLINKIRKVMPRAAITTDIIVGFPGENKKHFTNTLKLFKEIGFDMAYIAQYSPRPGTAAAKLEDDVSRQEKKVREEKLMVILRQTARANNKRYLGASVKVLIENKKGEWLFGKTNTNKNVKIKADASVKNLVGQFAQVKITGAENFGLKGELNTVKKVIVILGPTASGKTGLGVKLAARFAGEIISADSRQVYRGMDIGTGKDLDEYDIKKGNKKISIPYHLIDVASPRTEFNLIKFQRLAFKAMDDILKRKKIPIIVGGTGLYLEALVDNYDLTGAKPDKVFRERMEKKTVAKILSLLKKINPELAAGLNASEQKNKRRLIRYLEIQKYAPADKKNPGKNKSHYEFLLLGLMSGTREELNKKIYKRLIDRLEKEGMIEEVKRLREEGVSWKRLKGFGLEYKFISLYLEKEINYETMAEKLYIAIRQFAKRQMTWFRRWERNGAKIYWLKNKEEAAGLVDEFLKK